MNIAKELIARIEEARSTTKTPCKSYRTEEGAEKVAEERAAVYGEAFDKDGKPCRYLVLFNEEWCRWVVCFDMTEMCRRTGFMGGYVGLPNDNGHFTF